MYSHLILGASLISQGLAAVVAHSPSDSATPAHITPGPQVELLRKQNNDRFMGYVELTPNTWTSLTCASGNTVYQTGDYWACCATTRTGCLPQSMPIACVAGNMVFRAATTGSVSLTNSLVTKPCTSIWSDATDASYTVCNTASLFENDRSDKARTQIFCGLVSSNWSYYRQLPAKATSASRSSSGIPSAASTPSSRSALVTPTSSPTIIPPPPPPAEEKKSKAWIAGAVIGPLVGLALIGGLIFFCLRRRKNKTPIAPATGGIGPAPTAYLQTAYGSPGPNSTQPYYPPPMQQNQGFAPVGVAKQDGYYPPQTQSPVTQGSHAPSMYGAPQQQQWQQGQSVYGAPSPSMSPQPQHVQTAPYVAGGDRPFSSELEGSHGHGQPELVSVQPKGH